jgi:hypothetical protein
MSENRGALEINLVFHGNRLCDHSDTRFATPRQSMNYSTEALSAKCFNMLLIENILRTSVHSNKSMHASIPALEN